VRWFVRRAGRIVLMTALVGVAIRVARKVFDLPADNPGGDATRTAIRTGSFDSWPAVPIAPGPHRSGG
jgi:hypothetical protein